MVGATNGNPASGDQADASTRTEFRKAPPDVNRIPGSAASMKVQERLKSDAATTSTSASTSSSKSPLSNRSTSGPRSKTAIQAMQPFLDSSTNADSPIQPTDIQLLTTSILSNQERQRVILYYQEQLIDSEPSLVNLKKSLLFLSSSSWGQILEERKLAGKCSYPPCSNTSPSMSGVGRGKFRINLRNKSVKAVEDLDPGEAGNTYDDLRDYFCNKACYARSEWILRWVLSDKEIGLPEGDSAKSGGRVLGGKWQKLTSQPSGGYEQVELLEDIEREHGVDFASDDQDKSLLLDSVPASTDAEATRATEDDLEDDLESRQRQLSHILRYASLAPGSRPPRRPLTRNTTIHLTPTPSPPSLAAGDSFQPPSHSNHPDENARTDKDNHEDEELTLDPKQAAERAEIRRVMNIALDVRREQREQGLLD